MSRRRSSDKEHRATGQRQLRVGEEIRHLLAELLERVANKESDAPLCFTCGTKMRPAGSCYVCEGCGSTSGCS